MLPARPGMLAMTLRSFLRSHAAGQARPVAFIPVYIGYERVIESASYQRELRGGRKRKETPLALLRVVGKLRQPFGRVSLSVREPLRVRPTTWTMSSAPTGAGSALPSPSGSARWCHAWARP